MSAVRSRVADAAVALVGSEGIHALTHARVDAAAGVPRGSTSNYFRTRAALVAGVVERLEEQHRADWARLYDVAIPTVDALVEALSSYVAGALGADRSRTIARYALFLESIHNDATRAVVTQGRQQIEDWAQGVLAELGARDPREATSAITAYLDGLILHRLALPIEDDLRPGLSKAIRSAMT